MSQSIWPVLHCILQVESPVASISQELLETRRVLRRRDDQNVADPRQHQRAQRIVDHRFVVDGKQLLRDCLCDWVEPRAGPAGQNNAFTLNHNGLS